jgi:gluconolactonase
MALAALAAAPAAQAVPNCTNPPAPHVLYSGFGTLESVISDSHGRLYFTDPSNDRIMRADDPGAAPQPFATGVDSGGGMVIDPATGDILAGYGDALANGLTGLLNPQAGVVRVNKDTGAVTPYATGTQMSNGLAMGPDGALYASNDVGLGIDRIDPGTHAVHLNWASLYSSNGLVVDSTGTWLYAAQTFQPPAIARIKLSDPTNLRAVFNGGPEDLIAGLDGLTRDEHDNLYVAANTGAAVFKVDPATGAACALVRGLTNPSAVGFGGGDTGFVRSSLYVVGFGGQVVELPNVREAAIPPPVASPSQPGSVKRKKRKRCHRKKHRRKVCKKRKR